MLRLSIVSVCACAFTLASSETAHLPSPNLTFCPKWEVSVNVYLAEPVGGQFPRNLNWSASSTGIFFTTTVIKYLLLQGHIIGDYQTFGKL